MDDSRKVIVPLGGLDFHVMRRDSSEDGGTTIEVYGDVKGQPFQVLRFDMFRKDPHFHYAPGDRARNIQLHLDQKLAPHALEWAMDQIRDNIPEMLRIAGFGPLAERVDREALASGWTRVRDAAQSVRVGATP